MSTMVIRKIDNLILRELQEIPYNSKREILTYIKTMKARTSGNTVAALSKTSGLWKGLLDADRLKKEIYSDRLVSTRSEATF